MFLREIRVLCRRCNIKIIDAEPMSKYGEFYHPKTDCTNAGRYLQSPLLPKNTNQHPLKEKSGELKLWNKKTQRGATKRGARLAKKYRPK